MLDLTILRKFALEDDAIHLSAMAEAQASILASLMHAWGATLSLLLPRWFSSKRMRPLA